MQKTSPRFDILAAAKGWTPDAKLAADGVKTQTVPDVEKIFGESTFGLAEMKAEGARTIGAMCPAATMVTWCDLGSSTHITNVTNRSSNSRRLK